MNKPKIRIDGKEIEMGAVKARLWKVLMQFHGDRKNIETADLIEKYCEIIAVAFGVTTDEVLDNLNIDEVAETYYNVFEAVVGLLTAKIDKKNAEAEIAAQA